MPPWQSTVPMHRRSIDWREWHVRTRGTRLPVDHGASSARAPLLPSCAAAAELRPRCRASLPMVGGLANRGRVPWLGVPWRASRAAAAASQRTGQLGALPLWHPSATRVVAPARGSRSGPWQPLRPSTAAPAVSSRSGRRQPLRPSAAAPAHEQPPMGATEWAGQMSWERGRRPVGTP